MAYDAARGVTVLFGGRDNVHNYGETWEWNGAAWTQRAVSCPSARESHAMAHATARGATVPFGGYAIGSETWGLRTSCYPNCDGSTTPPILNVLDFTCFLNRFAAGCN
jgi:hypothetical protein